MYAKAEKGLWSHQLHQRVLLVLVLSAVNILLASAGPRIAKPGCKDRCGKVSIPYPFGIGPNCYHNSWFDVECTKSRDDAFKLKAVMHDGSGPLVVHWGRDTGDRTLAFWTHCSGPCGESPSLTEMDESIIDFKGSPFLYSGKHNILMVLGCGNAVVLQDRNNNTVAGCAAVCNDREIIGTIFDGNATGNNCHGIGCCQATIPSSLDHYTLKYISLNFNPKDKMFTCMMAKLVDSSWLPVAKFPEDICPTSTILEWTVTDLPIDSPSYANSTCAATSAANGGGYDCRCKAPFYEGNPYLPHGCQVVKECESCVDNCIPLSGNNTYGCDPSQDKTLALTVGLGLGISMGSIISGFVVYWLYHLIKKRRIIRLKAKYFETNGGFLLKQQMSSEEGNEKSRIFTSDDLEKATGQYNDDLILGHGGQGTVYKGMLSDGKIVAIKKSKIVDESQLSVFINEVVLLSNINHRNVVKLLGCCLETEVPMLVYEYVPNGTLTEHIHAPEEHFPITWEMRLQIATDIASALVYLHSSLMLPIFHRDIKSSNILLDNKYRAKLSDFGISKSIASDQTHITTRVVGTFGYLDPEYFQTNQFTDKSDVYSFGVVLVELLTWKTAMRSTEDEEMGLVSWFLRHLEHSSLHNILDARVLREGGEAEIIAVAGLTRRCLNLDGKRRPTMKEVSVELENIRSAHIECLERNPSVRLNSIDLNEENMVPN